MKTLWKKPFSQYTYEITDLARVNELSSTISQINKKNWIQNISFDYNFKTVLSHSCDTPQLFQTCNSKDTLLTSLGKIMKE